MVLLGVNGMVYEGPKSAARWQIEYTVKDTYQGGGILAAGTTKYSDKKIFAQLTWSY